MGGRRRSSKRWIQGPVLRTRGDEVNGQALDPPYSMAELLLRFRWIELSKQLRPQAC